MSRSRGTRTILAVIFAALVALPMTVVWVALAYLLVDVAFDLLQMEYLDVILTWVRWSYLGWFLGLSVLLFRWIPQSLVNRVDAYSAGDEPPRKGK